MQELLDNIGTLSSVYHKPPDNFISRTRLAVTKGDDLETHRFDESEDGSSTLARIVHCVLLLAIQPRSTTKDTLLSAHLLPFAI